MISVDAYMLIVASGLLAFGVVVLFLGLRQKDEEDTEGHDVPAE